MHDKLNFAAADSALLDAPELQQLHKYAGDAEELRQQCANASDATVVRKVPRFLRVLFEYVAVLVVVRLLLLLDPNANYSRWYCCHCRGCRRFLRPYQTVTLHEVVYCGAGPTSRPFITNLANVR